MNKGIPVIDILTGGKKDISVSQSYFIVEYRMSDWWWPVFPYKFQTSISNAKDRIDALLKSRKGTTVMGEEVYREYRIAVYHRGSQHIVHYPPRTESILITPPCADKIGTE